MEDFSNVFSARSLGNWTARVQAKFESGPKSDVQFTWETPLCLYIRGGASIMFSLVFSRGFNLRER